MSISKIDPEQKLKPYDPLWRYMKISAFFLLIEGKAFFPSIATLQSGDPLEGDLFWNPVWLMNRLCQLHGNREAEFDDWLVQRMENWEKDLLKRNPNNGMSHTGMFSKAYVRELAKRRAVWCWFKSHDESAALWSVYGVCGIAVGTSLEKLERALPVDRDFQIAPITYANRSNPISLSPEFEQNRELIHRPHLVKGVEYEHEKEVRITTTCSPDLRGRLVDGIRAKEMIEHVIISPLIPFDEAEALCQQIKQLGWSIGSPDIRRSSILGSIADREARDSRFSQIKIPFPEEPTPLPPPLDKL
jgi:hypothetical protein